jgi:hypothetical protein
MAVSCQFCDVFYQLIFHHWNSQNSLSGDMHFIILGMRCHNSKINYNNWYCSVHNMSIKHKIPAP